jgi:hypothetical protein
VKWVVLTPEIKPNPAAVYFALTPEQYERLALNMSRIKRWMEEAAWRLKYYRGELPDADAKRIDSED